MIDRLLTALGIDPPQWRALTWAYLVMDLRRTGGPKKPGQSRFANTAYAALLIVTAISGAGLAVLAFALRNAFTATVLVVTYVLFNTAILLFLDFTTLVVSPDDYRLLAPRPISSRTFFGARVASILVYVGVIAATMTLFPALALWLWHGLGPLGFVGAMLASVLCSVWSAIAVMSVYGLLVRVVSPSRLTRIITYVHLVAVTGFLAVYSLVFTIFEHPWLRDFDVARVRWAWLYPGAWFASLVPVLSATGERLHTLGAIAALTITAITLPIASSWMTLEYAQQLAEQTATGSEAEGKRRRGWRIPGFRRNEARAIALLIASQFRHEMRFRLGVLTIVPLTVFYVLLGGQASLADPFSAPSEFDDTGPQLLYFSLCLMPMTLHATLMSSPSWAAAWVFFATPSDPGRLIVAAKNYITVFFLGGYLLFVGIMWAFFFDTVWHALAHAVIVGAIVHVILQVAVIANPIVPFSMEPHAAQRSAHTIGLMFVISIVGGAMPFLLPLVYERPPLLAVFVVLLIVMTAGLEFVLRLRARDKVADLEFLG